MDIYSKMRREPRVRLRTRVRIEGTTKETGKFSIETLTLDVSPHGASVVVEKPLPIGTDVEFIASRYPFRAHATVCTVTRDAHTGLKVLGLEYPDGERNPLVIWAAVEREDEAKRAAERTEPAEPHQTIG